MSSPRPIPFLRPAVSLLSILAVLAAPAANAAERLMVPRLSGWYLADTHHGGGVEVDDLLPRGQTLDNWTERLSIQAFRRTPMTARQFLDGVLAQTAAACAGGTADPVAMTRLDGVPAGRRIVSCGRYAGDGDGNVTLYYAIRGRAALYVLARSWRGPPFTPGRDQPVPASELARWNAAFDGVHLCDDTACARAAPAQTDQLP
jgi:hypothetical protein